MRFVLGLLGDLPYSLSDLAPAFLVLGLVRYVVLTMVLLAILTFVSHVIVVLLVQLGILSWDAGFPGHAQSHCVLMCHLTSCLDTVHWSHIGLVQHIYPCRWHSPGASETTVE